jgi:hypothetical protein
LPNLDDILELCFTNLGSWKGEFSPSSDRLRLFQLLDLSVTGGDELGLMVCSLPFLPRGVLPLTFFALCLFFLRFALVLEPPKSLANGSGRDTSLFLSSVVEASNCLFLKRDIGVVLTTDAEIEC